MGLGRWLRSRPKPQPLGEQELRELVRTGTERRQGMWEAHQKLLKEHHLTRYNLGKHLGNGNDDIHRLNEEARKLASDGDVRGANERREQALTIERRLSREREEFRQLESRVATSEKELDQETRILQGYMVALEEIIGPPPPPPPMPVVERKPFSCTSFPGKESSRA